MKEQDPETNASLVIRKLDEQHQKYRFMELNLLQKKRRLKKQIPDIKASLDVLNLIRSRSEKGEEMTSNFLLSDDVYMEAKIPPTNKINLWLGANVMLEYSLDEAEALLSKNLDTANKNLSQIDIDLDYLRDQITTTEVNMARVYNWDVKRRQAEKK
jgi:prefoldin subunit 5